MATCAICNRPTHVIKKCMYCHKTICTSCFSPPSACIRCSPKKSSDKLKYGLKPKPKPKNRFD